MPASSSRQSSLMLTRSPAAPVLPTAPLRSMIAADTSFLFFLCKTFLPPFLVTPSYRNQPPALSADSRPLLISQQQQETTTATRIPPSSKPTGHRRSSRLSAQNLVLTSLLWSLALVCVVDAQPAECLKSHPFIGYRGKLSPDIGTIEILDDCRFSHETRPGFNNASISGLRWGGQFQDSQGNLILFGVVSSSPISGSDLPVPYRLLPGLTWSSFDFLTVQAVSGEIVAAVPLGRKLEVTTLPAATTTIPPAITTTAAAGGQVPTTTTATGPTRTIQISPPGAPASTLTNGTALPLKAVPTITDPASPIVVRIGPNPNYPGLLPTVLNVSLWINDTESPVLVLTRGKRYTFSIQAGTAHPVYITTSREGGKKSVANSTELVLAGNLTTFGTVSSPMTWDFVAPLRGQVEGLNDTTALFYQCYVHRRMGWKIIFDDFKAEDPSTSGANVATRGAGSVAALAVLFLATAALML